MGLSGYRFVSLRQLLFLVPMFADGLPNAYVDSYSHEEEDFASKDAAQLDTWVFEKVKV